MPFFGFGASNLLTDDPAAWSLRDGSSGVNAGIAFTPGSRLPQVTCPEGWQWAPRSQWCLDLRNAASGASDAHGWEYAVSFGASERNWEPKAVGTVRGVRRRRYTDQIMHQHQHQH